MSSEILQKIFNARIMPSRICPTGTFIPGTRPVWSHSFLKWKSVSNSGNLFPIKEICWVDRRLLLERFRKPTDKYLRTDWEVQNERAFQIPPYRFLLFANPLYMPWGDGLSNLKSDIDYREKMRFYLGEVLVAGGEGEGCKHGEGTKG